MSSSFKVVFHQFSFSVNGCLPSNVIINGHLSSNADFNHSFCSIYHSLPSKILLHQRFSYIKGHILSKVVFHQNLCSIKGNVPSKVLFHWRFSSIKLQDAYSSNIINNWHRDVASLNIFQIFTLIFLQGRGVDEK